MVHVKATTLKQANAEAWVVGVDHDRKAPALKDLGLDSDPHLSRVLQDKKIGLGAKATRAVPVDKKWIILTGTGDPAKLTQEKLAAIASAGVKAASAVGADSCATTLLRDLADVPDAAQAIVQGVILGDLVFDQYKSKKDDEDDDKKHIEDVLVALPDGGRFRNDVNRAATMAHAVNDARLLANTPANIATPAYLAAEAKKRGRANGFKVSVKNRKKLREEGFNLLTGVAQGSANEEQLITMDYHPKDAKKTIVVVGKGVCFDSGGISLKPGNGMWDMKYDKCGACNTIALMAALKDLGVKHRVVGIVAAVENMPSHTAQRPGDIVTAKDGTTVEVLNTDAEGRLILGDAITHGRTFEPDWMCDMATLTGACDIAIGSTYVAVLSKDDAMAERFLEASHKAGDKAWRLPQGEEYDEANKGTYADLQNISLTNRAGTAIGGSFVSHFAKDTPFVHLDIASKAWTSGAGVFKKGPTGAGTRIVLQALLDA